MQFIGEFSPFSTGCRGEAPARPRRGAVSEGGTPSDAHREVQENCYEPIGFCSFLLPYVFRYSQFSCGFRRAPRRSGPPSALPAAVLGAGGFAPSTPPCVAATQQTVKLQFETQTNVKRERESSPSLSPKSFTEYRKYGRPRHPDRGRCRRGR